MAFAGKYTIELKPIRDTISGHDVTIEIAKGTFEQLAEGDTDEVVIIIKANKNIRYLNPQYKQLIINEAVPFDFENISVTGTKPLPGPINKGDELRITVNRTHR